MGTKVERALKGKIEFSKKHGGVLKAKPLGEGYPAIGLDIEADVETAMPFCMAVDFKEVSEIYSLNNWNDCLRALTRGAMRYGINFFYNLQYDFEGLCKFLEHEAWLNLLGGRQVKLDYSGRLVDDGDDHYCKLMYVPKKAFTLQVKTNTYRFFDGWQYYLMSLQNAVKKNLPGEAKGDFDAGESSIKRYKTDRRYRDRIHEYCLGDARLSRLLGQLIVDGANRFVNTKKFYSSASVAEQYFRSQGFRIPSVPKGVHRLFMRTYRGGRFEMSKRGVIDGVTLEDIKSAYPYAMTRMPILDDSVKVKRIQSDRDMDARFGAYCIDAHVPFDWYLSPLAKKRDGTLYFPTGDFFHYWTDKNTLDLLDRLGLDYRIRAGVELHQKEVEYKLKTPMELLFQMKEDKKNNPPSVCYAAKINMNGLYGKLIQLIDDVEIRRIQTLEELNEVDYTDLIESYDTWYIIHHTQNFRTGSLFSPFYASFITSHARAQLFERAMEIRPENVVAMHTDSIAHTGVAVESGSQLGDWEIEEPYRNCRMGIVKCGFYEVVGDGFLVRITEAGETEPVPLHEAGSVPFFKHKVKSRGIGKTSSLIEEFYRVKRRYGMNQAIRRERERLNVISEQIVVQNMDTDKKRLWHNELTRETYREGVFIDSDAIQA